jgi:hypothetical protein
MITPRIIPIRTPQAVITVSLLCFQKLPRLVFHVGFSEDRVGLTDFFLARFGEGEGDDDPDVRLLGLLGEEAGLAGEEAGLFAVLLGDFVALLVLDVSDIWPQASTVSVTRLEVFLAKSWFSFNIDP